MSELASITDAVVVLQEAQAKLVAATERFLEHYHDENAHSEIWTAIRRLEDSDVMYTRADIKNLIEDVVGQHINTSVQDGAHPDWQSFVNTIDEWKEAINQSIHTLSQKVDAYVEEQELDQTTLAGRLQAIEDRYAPVLANLQAAYQNARDANNTQLAETYYASIRETINAKRDELLAAMSSYQANS